MQHHRCLARPSRFALVALSLLAGCNARATDADRAPGQAQADPPSAAPARAVRLLDEEYPKLAKDVRNDIPIRVGMSWRELQEYVASNNEKVRAFDREDDSREEERPPAFARPELHFYLFLEVCDEEGVQLADGSRAMSYCVNGRRQFWMDICLERDVIKNIYITPGNFSVVFPPGLYEGEGPHVGLWANVGEQHFSENDQE